MHEWEYQIGRSDRNIGLFKVGNWQKNFTLEEMGSNGWELVAVLPIASISGLGSNGVTTEILYYFKRLVQK
jgi:hypothetical protein